MKITSERVFEYTGTEKCGHCWSTATVHVESISDQGGVWNDYECEDHAHEHWAHLFLPPVAEADLNKAYADHAVFEESLMYAHRMGFKGQDALDWAQDTLARHWVLEDAREACMVTDESLQRTEQIITQAKRPSCDECGGREHVRRLLNWYRPNREDDGSAMVCQPCRRRTAVQGI